MALSSQNKTLKQIEVMEQKPFSSAEFHFNLEWRSQLASYGDFSRNRQIASVSSVQFSPYLFTTNIAIMQTYKKLDNFYQ